MTARRYGTGAMSWMLDGVGRVIARYLEKPAQGYEPFTPSDVAALRAALQTGDVLLIEGNSHISGVIKYLTQSTWSHAALYVGPIAGAHRAGRRAACPDRSQCGRRRGVGAAVQISSLPHARLPAGRPDRAGLGCRSATMRPRVSASPTTSRTSPICCAIFCRCRCRSVGGGA